MIEAEIISDDNELTAELDGRGDRGPIGKTPNLQIGIVETLDAGNKAFVTRDGTNENPIFNFGIPQGEKGDIGPIGKTGPSGVYKGETEPANPDVNVWIDPNGKTTKYAKKTDLDNLENKLNEKIASGELNGVGITKITNGQSEIQDDYTVTPIEFHKSDGTSSTVKASAKNGTNGQDGVGITTITSGQPTVEDDKTVTPVIVQKTDGSSENFKVEAKNGLDGQNGKDGKDGVNGQDGLTPSIGENGNWYLGDTDTGKPSRGEVGPTPDLSDYVKNTDYAKDGQGGVISTGNHFRVYSNNGVPYVNSINSEQYSSSGDNIFVGKGTLENIKDYYVGSSQPVQDLTATVTNVQNDQDEGMPKQTASGEMITVDDALAYKTFNVTVDGASEQETTTGKNLLPYPYVDTTKTEKGITFTDNGDGTITVNGTATAGVFFQIFATQINQEEIPGNYISGSVTGCGVVVAHKQDTTYTTLGASSNGNSSLINKETYATGYIELSISQGTTLNNVIVKPMLTLEQDTDYEPYTGGQPSPNPDYPQEITTLTFDKITRCGKNMTDISSTSYSQNCTVENSVATTIPLNNYGWANIGMTPIIIPAGTYYLSCDIRLKSGTANKMNYLRLTECDFTSVTNPAMTNDFQRYVFSNTVSQQERYTTFGIQTDAATDAVLEIKNIMISKENSEYEPYQATEYTIDLQGNEMVELPNSVKDELVVDKYGNVSLIKNVGKVILDGSEDWICTNNKAYTLLADINLPWCDVTDVPNIISDMFITDKNDNIYSRNNIISTYIPTEQYNYQKLVISKYDFNGDVDMFKSFLSTHNVTFYYQLENPKVIPLGKLTNLITTEEGINNFFINGNLETTLEVLYALDIKKYIYNKIAELSAQLIRGE